MVLIYTKIARTGNLPELNIDIPAEKQSSVISILQGRSTEERVYVRHFDTTSNRMADRCYASRQTVKYSNPCRWFKSHRQQSQCPSKFDPRFGWPDPSCPCSPRLDRGRIWVRMLLNTLSLSIESAVLFDKSKVGIHWRIAPCTCGRRKKKARHIRDPFLNPYSPDDDFVSCIRLRPLFGGVLYSPASSFRSLLYSVVSSTTPAIRQLLFDSVFGSLRYLFVCYPVGTRYSLPSRWSSSGSYSIPKHIEQADT